MRGVLEKMVCAFSEGILNTLCRIQTGGCTTVMKRAHTLLTRKRGSSKLENQMMKHWEPRRMSSVNQKTTETTVRCERAAQCESQKQKRTEEVWDGGTTNGW